MLGVGLEMSGLFLATDRGSAGTGLLLILLGLTLQVLDVVRHVAADEPSVMKLTGWGRGVANGFRAIRKRVQAWERRE